MLDNEPTGAEDGATTSTDVPTARKATKKATAKKATASTTKKSTATKKAAVKKTSAKKTSAKKATAKATAAADEPSDADAPAPVKKAAKKAVKKASKKATAKASAAAEAPAEVELTPDSAPEAATEASTPARKRASRKKATVPAFTAPALTDDEAAEEEAAAVAAAAAAAVPGVLFQPPTPVAAPKRTRRSPKPAPDAEAPEIDEDATAEASDDDEQASDAGEGGTRRRRRRGGRGRRGRGGSGEGVEDADGDSAEGTESVSVDGASDQPAEGEGDEEGGSSRRRRSRRRRSGGGDGEGAEESSAAPRTRAARSEEPKGIKGSVRIEAKRQRRREGREAGRRRPPVLTEAEFLARREAVDRVMVVRQTGDRTQIAVLEDNVLVEHHVSRETTGSMIGNVYLGRVQNVLPSMEAAFIDIGRGRNAVLYAGEVNWDAAGLEGQPKRIEVALKSGDSVLVQVTKDPVGHKGARLTSQISLPGRYLVYVPDGSMTGISRKLPDTERSRLKSILKRVLPENAGVIVRTASEGASEEELSRDVARLSAQWDDIHAKSKTASAPSLLYAEPDLTVRVIRDIFNEDFAKLVVAGPGAWETVEPYVAHVAPDLADRLERWTSEKDVWSEFRIDEQLAKALDRKVWLPSGGSLVIDRTEAMTVIDVNTGKFTGQGGNLEQTVTENNLEAAEEIVRQLRLRDIGGIIVVDFIDMVLESNRELVLRRLIECLGRDRTKHQVAEVTSLGLVQMTRKRVGQGLLEVFSTTCDACNGRGLHVHMEPVDDQQRRRGESDGRGKDGKDKSDKSKGGKSKGKDGKDKSDKDKSDKDKSDKDKGKGSKDKTASDESGSDTAVDAVPGASADQGGITLAPENGSSEGPAPEGGRRQRRRGRGGAGASDQDGGSSSEPVATAPSVSEPADSAAPAPEAAPPVEPVRAAPVLAPRGIDLTPDLPPATTPKRRRRAASRPAGAPTGQESGS